MAFHHVTARRNVDLRLFVDDHDRRRFLQQVAETVQRKSWLCHAYCLMTNHYHLLLETPESELSPGMVLLNGWYARYFNHRHATVGHVFQSRYHDEPVTDDDHLLETCRYIVRNPVRAGLVARAVDWEWSSYRATAGLAAAPPCLTTAFVRRLFSSIGEYVDFCNQVAEQPGCNS